MTLAEETAAQVNAGTTKLSKDESESLLREIPQWDMKEDSLKRTFDFNDFGEAIDFVNDIADIADTQNHHPDIDIRFNKVRIVLSTHKVGGLTRNDFIVAAKIDQLI